MLAAGNEEAALELSAELQDMRSVLEEVGDSLLQCYMSFVFVMQSQMILDE